MKRSARIRLVCVTVAAATVLASCSSSGGSAKKSGTLHMGMAVANISLNFASEMVDGAKQAVAHENDVDLKVVGPPNTDGPAEQQLFTSLTSSATDGIVLENLDPPIFTHPAAQAIDKGVPVIALDTSPTPGSKVDFYVGNDNYNLGVMLAQQALKRMPAKPTGSIVIGVPNPGTPVLDSRAKGISDTFKAKAPGVKVLGPFQTYSDPSQNFTAWQSLVNANPNALAYLGVGDADSYDLAKIKQRAHGKYLVAGMDVDAKTLEDVKAGLLFCTIDPEHFLKGYLAMHMLIDSRRGTLKLPSGWFETPGAVVDKTNIDSIIKREQTPADAYTFYKSQIDKLLADPTKSMHPMSDAR